MKYLPFENLTLTTSLNSEEVKERLLSILKPVKNFRLIGINGVFSGGKPQKYEGTINGDEFNVSRIISYQNSFLPRIKGQILKRENGAEVVINMRLNLFVSIFLLAWIGGVFIGCIVSLVAIIYGTDFNTSMLIPFGMLIFAYLLVMLAFKLESKKSIKFFKELLEAEVKKDSVLIERY